MQPGPMVKNLVNSVEETFSLGTEKRVLAFNEESDRTRFVCHKCSQSNELNLAVISLGKWQ